MIRQYDDEAEHLGLNPNWPEQGWPHYLAWFFTRWLPALETEERSAGLLDARKPSDFYRRMSSFETWRHLAAPRLGGETSGGKCHAVGIGRELKGALIHEPGHGDSSPPQVRPRLRAKVDRQGGQGGDPTGGDAGADRRQLDALLDHRGDDQAAKETLARTCDNQPFIAGAPLVLLFLADYQRWYDYFLVSGVPEMCKQDGRVLRQPEEGHLLLACCDALIAAQTAVMAAESLGIGSCYIGDIMENYETHQELFELPPYALPICLVCFGYPTAQQRDRPQTSRFGQEFVVFRDRYHRLEAAEFRSMFAAS